MKENIVAGIAGVYKREEGLLKPMLEKLEHRGPCGKRIFRYKGSMLGCTVHPNGGFFKDYRGCISVDGEIYNPDQLKIDCRNLLSLFRRKETGFLKYINGKFAIAIIDNGHLVLARDRLGVKPLYYSTEKNGICFASEIKALQEVAKEIKFLPPGHFLNSKHGLHRYWKMSCAGPSLSNPSEIIPLLRKNLEKAVCKRLKGKSRVGVFLSGGIDSSIIAYLVKKNFKNVVFFSVGVKGSSDIKFASMLAKYLKVPHCIHTYDLKEMKKVLPEVIYHLESFDYLLVRSCIPNFMVSRLAGQKNIDTVFIGEGGDELFAGYEFLRHLRGVNLQRKSINLIQNLHNTGLQRCDRMPLSFGVEAKIPFLDIDFVKFALGISTALRVEKGKQEKWILRKSFEDVLPREIVRRKKQKFSQGSGSYKIMKKVANTEISDREFKKEKKIGKSFILRNKEELLYYRIFKKFFPYNSILGQTSEQIVRFSLHF